MNYKTPNLVKEFDGAPLILKLILIEADKFTQGSFNKELTLTRILGSIAGDSGVHADYRAADCRNEYLGHFTFTQYETDALVKYMNMTWKRNDGFDTVISHSFKGSVLHFHFQIPLYTKSYG